MKIVTYLLGALLAAALGAAALFYFMTFQPMAADYTRMKAGMPEMDRAKAELRKCKEKEAKESAWINPVVGQLNSGLQDEIKTDKAEVAVSGNTVVVNISEDIMYTPGSVTFAKDSPQLRLKLAALLANKELKGKQITVGNSTSSVPAQGKGKRRIPPRDGRTLGAERSLALAKYFEQNNVDKEALAATGFSSKMPDTGFRIKEHKTVILINNPAGPAAIPVPSKPAATPIQPVQPAKPAEKAPAGAKQAAPAAAPVKPAQPKGQ